MGELVLGECVTNALPINGGSRVPGCLAPAGGAARVAYKKQTEEGEVDVVEEDEEEEGRPSAAGGAVPV